MIDEVIEPASDEQASANDHQAKRREDDVARQCDLPIKPRWQRHDDAGGAPDDLHERVEDQNKPEGGEYVVEMVARIEIANDDPFGRQPNHGNKWYGEQNAPDEGARGKCQRCTDERADHVERAVSEIDKIHDAEGERQAGSQQE